MNLNIPLLKSTINFRDLGSLKNRHGQKIKTGKLFRSGDFSLLTDADRSKLNHQIDFILDYRDDIEVEKRPDKLWQGAQYYNVPANPLTSDVTAATTDESKVAQQQLSNYLKKQGAEFFMLTLYERLPFHNKAYKKLIDLLLNHNGRSLVQHCAVGKDRTGIGVAITLLILDFDKETIINDYLKTQQGLTQFRTQLLNGLRSELTTTQLAEREILYSAQLNFIQTFFKTVKQKYISFDEWLLKEYNVDQEKKKQIQSYYLE